MGSWKRLHLQPAAAELEHKLQCSSAVSAEINQEPGPKTLSLQLLFLCHRNPELSCLIQYLFIREGSASS